MHKKVLSETVLYYGDISMPKGFEIKQEVLSNNILQSKLQNKETDYSKSWDMLNTYIIDFFNVNYKKGLTNKKTWGEMYLPNQKTHPISEVDYLKLNESPDFVCLYGVKVKDCSVNIIYDDNKIKNNFWKIPLVDNRFIIFPSTNQYYIENNQKNLPNFIQTITYELK